MYSRLKVVIGGWWVFGAILGIFALQAGFFALTSAFPMAFDERYHFALVQHYGETLTPVIGNQPAELGLVGDATRLTSYLSHYVLGYVLDLVSIFTHDQTVQVVTLRFVNIAFVIGALVLFRLFLLRLTGSGLVSNMTILIFCLLPVTSLLAAHINYDNPLLLCFAAVLVVAQIIMTRLNEGSAIRRELVGLVGLLAVGCLIKFTFLPIAAAITLFVTTIIIVKKAWRASPGFSMKRRRIDYRLVGLGVFTLLSLGMCVERYGGNVAQYGTVQPDCATVQPLATCLQYGAWARNYALKATAANDTAFQGPSIQGYIVKLWAPLMTKGLGFIGNGQVLLDPPAPVKVLLTVLAGMTVAGVTIALLVYRKNTMILMILFAGSVYVAALLQRNYSEFMQMHELIAVQGRYIVPLLIPVIAISIKALLEMVRIKRMAQGVLVSAIVGLVIFNPYVAYSMTRPANDKAITPPERYVTVR